MKALTQEQILSKAIDCLYDYINNADLDKETNIDIIFGDDCTPDEIETIKRIGKSFLSFSVLYDYDIVSAEQLEFILEDFKSKLEPVKNND